MTQPPTAEVQRPPSLSGPGSVRSSVRPNAPARRQTNPLRPGTQVVDLTDDVSEREGAHPAKRRRLEESNARQKRSTDVQIPLQMGEVSRPFGRQLHLSFAAQLAQIKQATAANGPSGPAASNTRPPPLPVRPWKHQQSQEDPAGGGATPGTHFPIDYGNVEATPFRLEPPQRAPIYRDGRVADFVPWRGKHPEDVMNESTAKHGYYDRQISQNENGTARPSLYSVFKHKSGLDTLSSLFLRVMEQRESHGKIGTASSFKPPPRVTLTEAKRKAWLNDLSDPNVPLRKLSRTIPQGIRGQQLLDQCLLNAIPLGRAVWFAKCVGANEIRTLRRKETAGTFVAGAELKWLKEWTAGVGHFLDTVISSCGQPGWKQKMTYALNIATRFYSENMVDKDHFIEWIVSSVSKSSLDMLFLWSTVCRGFMEDALRFRRHGRVLAESLLQHLKEAIGQDIEEFTPLVSIISESIRMMAYTRPLVLFLPHVWEDYSDVFKSCLVLSEPVDRKLYAEISTQNRRFKPMKDSISARSLCPKQTVIRVLDAAKAPYYVTRISEACLHVCGDRYSLVRTLLEWSATPFRTGSARRYLVVHLLRRWYATGIDIDQPVRDLIMDHDTFSLLDNDAFFNVAADLFRSKTISVSRCLQLALATGASANPNSTAGLLRLIREVPVEGLPPHIVNLRSSILRGRGFMVETEREQIDARKRAIAQRLPGLCGWPSDDMDIDGLPSSQQLLPQCNGFEVSQWLLGCVADHHKASVIAAKDPNTGNDRKICEMTTGELQIVRSELEELETIPILADVLRHACASDDDMVLAMVSETVNAHLEEFSAIGALDPLCTLLEQAYSRIRTSTSLFRSLVVSLLNLSSRLRGGPIKPAPLHEDLARGDRSVAIAACSPISDHMAESLQMAGSSFIDEFDQLLSTGNIMDDQAMTRLFYTLTERIELAVDACQADTIGLCHMILRLMTFRPQQHHQLMTGWLQRLLQSPKSISVQIFQALISSGVITTNEAVLASSGFVLHSPPGEMSDELRNVRTHLSTLFENCPSKKICANDPGLYRIRYCTLHCLLDSSVPISMVVGSLADETMTAKGFVPDRSSWAVKHVIRRLVAKSADARPSVAESPGLRVTGYMLGLPGSVQSVGLADISRVVDSPDLFSLPLRMAYVKQVYTSLPIAEDEMKLCQEDVTDLIFAAGKKTPEEESGSWTALLTVLGIDAARKVRQQAEDAFFSLPPPHPRESRNDQSGQRLVAIIEKTSFTIQDSGSLATATILAERLQALFRLVSLQSHQAVNEDGDELAIWTGPLRDYLTLLLRLTSLHRPSFCLTPSAPQSSTAQTQSQVLIRTLLLLTSLALHPSLQIIMTPAASSANHKEPPILLSTYALDVAALLSDNLSEESRLLAAKTLKDRMRDPRAQFLFGSLNCGSSSSPDPHNELIISREGGPGKEPLSTEYKVKSWELVQGISSAGAGAAGTNTAAGNDTSMSLSLFQGRMISGKSY